MARAINPALSIDVTVLTDPRSILATPSGTALLRSRTFPHQQFGPDSRRRAVHLTWTEPRKSIQGEKAGGTVNFIVSGFHQVIVYGDGTRPDDIDTSDTVPATVQPGPPLISDANNRVFRGIDPSVLPALQGPPQGPRPPVLQDRIEAVQFAEAGRYLVICGVLPHFLSGMYGDVKVNP